MVAYRIASGAPGRWPAIVGLDGVARQRVAAALGAGAIDLVEPGTEQRPAAIARD